MSHSHIVMLTLALVVLILISGFFSAAETGLMAINRYRLRHKARMKKRSAILILRLLKRPDRLLGMILIGNSFSNILASSLATLIAVSLFGNTGVIISTIILTFIVLVFAEVAPKTLAALYPESTSNVVSFPIFILLKIFYPLVWLVNAIANGLLRLFRIKVTHQSNETLSREELRSVVYETSGRSTHKYQAMLLSILDLNIVSVGDVMVPRHEIVGINLGLEWNVIHELITKSIHDRIPMYQDNINNIVGILHLRELMHAILLHRVVNKELLVKLAHEPYFVPETTPLNVQLLNFQKRHMHMALVVDEYGEIQGLITLADILEEIIGEYTSDVGVASKSIQLQADGSYLVDGSVEMREFNRITGLTLPTDGPRTLSGVIIEYLEIIPRAGTCVLIQNCPIEITEVDENRVKRARVFPPLAKETTNQDFPSF